MIYEIKRPGKNIRVVNEEFGFRLHFWEKPKDYEPAQTELAKKSSVYGLPGVFREIVAESFRMKDKETNEYVWHHIFENFKCESNENKMMRVAYVEFENSDGDLYYKAYDITNVKIYALDID